MLIWKYFSSITKKLPINNGSYLQPISRRWFTKTSQQNIQNRFNMNEKRLKTKDSIAETYKLIYKAPMESYISFTKHMSSFTSLTIGGLYIYEYYAINYKNMKATDTSITDSTVLSVNNDINKFAVGFLIVNTAIFIFSGRYALRIYKLNRSYVAIFEGSLPFFKKHVQFSGGQLKEAPGGLPFWRDIRYKIKSKTVYLLNDHFKTISELNIMLKKVKQ